MTKNFKNDPSLLDSAEISGIDCEGDERTTTITLNFDISDDCYVVEQKLDGDHQECESFADRDDADRTFDRWVKETHAHYASEKQSFERGRIELTAEALETLALERATELDPDAIAAINLLAEIIKRGNAKQVADDLEYATRVIYCSDPVH